MTPFGPAALVALAFAFAAATALAADAHQPTDKTKRQIFREQVLPQLGGKIPEEAFRADRLALNRLNKEGVALPDGVLLDARRRAHPHPRQHSDLQRHVVKVLLTPDTRYTAPEGQSHPQGAVTVDSTYIIRPPIGAPRPPPIVARPLPGPPLLIPTEAGGGGGGGGAGHHPQLQPPPPPPQAHPPPRPVYGPAHHGALPVATSFAEHFNGVFAPGGFDNFDLLVAEWNARAEREAARIAAAASTAWPPAVQPPHGNALGAGPAPGPAPGPGPGVDCAPSHEAAPRHYPDPARCQVFHVCQRDGRRDTFLCPGGTLYSAHLARCDWWYNVRC